MELLLKLGIEWFLQAFVTDQCCQFVGVLEAGRDSYCSHPVVIIEALVKSKADKGLLRHPRFLIAYTE